MTITTKELLLLMASNDGREFLDMYKTEQRVVSDMYMIIYEGNKYIPFGPAHDDRNYKYVRWCNILFPYWKFTEEEASVVKKMCPCYKGTPETLPEASQRVW